MQSAMSDEHSPEPEEPTDDEILEVMGGEELVPGVTLPTGAQSIANGGEDSVHLAQPVAAKGESEGLDAQDKGDKPAVSGEAMRDGGREDEAIPLCDAVKVLPSHWMRVYVLALHEHGSPAAAIKAVSATVGRITLGSIERASRECAEFGEMVAEHARLQHASIYGAIYKGGTEGDLMPYNTKDGVKWYKRRSDRAGEIWLKAHGLMADQQSLTVTHQGRVTMQHDDQLGSVLADVAAHLFGPGAGAPIGEATGITSESVVSKSLD